MNSKKKNSTRKGPVVLIVLDGWGISPPYAGNMIVKANTKFFDSLVSEYPSMVLGASGECIGLTKLNVGNSEMGHLAIGSGRIIYQDLLRINNSIKTEEIFNNKVLNEAISHVKNNSSKLHLIGLLSDGCVHSSIDHLKSLIDVAKKKGIKEIYIHAILDGVDTLKENGLKYVCNILEYLKESRVGKISTIIGRYYAMDKNNNWDRIEKAYKALIEGVGNSSDDPIDIIKKSYDKKIYDEEFLPIVLCDENKIRPRISDNDAVVFYNFRADRARQITEALVLNNFNKFKRNKKLKNLYFAGFTEYEKDLPIKVVFPEQAIEKTLGEVLAEKKIRQVKITETEKFAHVTYFLNGKKEGVFLGEDQILISSKSISSYDLNPEMSANEITKQAIGMIVEDKYDFYVINYPNSDMLAHTGNLDATVKAIEVVDNNLKKVIKSILDKRGIALVVSDHGNAELMLDLKTGQINKEHSDNPVPLILVGEEYAGKNIGWENVVGNDLSTVKIQGGLSDIAPTILEIFNIKKPDEMTGKSLI